MRVEVKDWDKTFIEIAEEFARHSTCVKKQVGAVLVKDLRILSTGYNGTPSGFCNCKDVFENGPSEIATKAIFYKNDFPSSLNSENLSKGYYFTHHEFAERFEIHAEQNCIAFAARNGVSTEDCTLYVTTAPCVHCAKIIIASKIKKVVYKEIYKNDFGIQLLEEADIEVSSLNL